MNPRANNYRIFGHKSGCGTAAVPAAESCAVPLVILTQISAWPGCELDQQVACEGENEPKQPQTLLKNRTKSSPDLLFSQAFFFFAANSAPPVELPGEADVEAMICRVCFEECFHFIPAKGRRWNLRLL